jgi:ABC-type multidrug transport system ATPase subunit
VNDTAPDSPITLSLNGSIATLGRAPESTVVIPSAGVSRHHATIVLTPNQPKIFDTNSRFGIMVDGKPTLEAPLQQGTEITLGVMRYRVELDTAILTLLPIFEPLSTNPLHPQGQGETIIRFGRDPRNDIPCSHPLVSRFHATFERRANGSCMMMDNHSANGTYVNGRKINAAQLLDHDIVQIGPYRFYYEHERLIQSDDNNRIKIQAQAISVHRGEQQIVHAISLVINPGEFIAILGPSGAGKSTLCQALTGQIQLSSGVVELNGMALDRFSDAYRSSIGYVSQHELLHRELSVAETFSEQCLLRLPADSTPAERIARIDEVLNLLDLMQLEKRLIQNLSGGELKRVHLGVELLSSPALIVLDEPLAGLDFGLIRSFMELFRSICDRGHTILLTTHTLEQLNLCDRLLFLKSGHLIYQGTPAAMPQSFGVETLADVYGVIKSGQLGELNMVPLDELAPLESSAPALRHDARIRIRKRSGAALHTQYWILSLRYTKILLRDWHNLVVVGAQVPAIALLMMFVYTPSVSFFPLSFYFCLTIASIWIGGLNTVREIAREMDIVEREVRAGVSLWAYGGAKITVFVFMAALQGVLFGLCLELLFKNFSLQGGSALLLAAGSSGGALLGLAISAVSRRVNRAISWLPIVFIPQIFFSGILIPFDRMSALGRILSRATIARPLFSLFKKSSVLEQPLWPDREWGWFFVLMAVLIIFLFAGLFGITARLTRRR